MKKVKKKKPNKHSNQVKNKKQIFIINESNEIFNFYFKVDLYRY